MDGNTKPMCTGEQTNTHEGKRDDSLPLEHVQQLEKKKHTDAGGGIIRGYWGEMLGKIFRYSQSRNSLTKYNIIVLYTLYICYYGDNSSCFIVCILLILNLRDTFPPSVLSSSSDLLCLRS